MKYLIFFLAIFCYTIIGYLVYAIARKHTSTYEDGDVVWVIAFWPLCTAFSIIVIPFHIIKKLFKL